MNKLAKYLDLKKKVKDEWKPLYMSYCLMAMTAILTGAAVAKDYTEFAAVAGAFYGLSSGITAAFSLDIESEIRGLESQIKRYERKASVDDDLKNSDYIFPSSA